MANIFRDQPKLRLGIGIALVALVWALYLVRATLGVGPMHDDQGNQAPAIHYLIGALVVTGNGSMLVCVGRCGGSEAVRARSLIGVQKAV